MTGDLTPWSILMSWNIDTDYDGYVNCTQDKCRHHNGGYGYPFFGDELDNVGHFMTALLDHIEDKHGIKLRPIRISSPNGEQAEAFKSEDKNSSTG
jgi:hypothetical protein